MLIITNKGAKGSWCLLLFIFIIRFSNNWLALHYELLTLILRSNVHYKNVTAK